jgi:hypothetical protein
MEIENNLAKIYDEVMGLLEQGASVACVLVPVSLSTSNKGAIAKFAGFPARLADNAGAIVLLKNHEFNNKIRDLSLQTGKSESELKEFYADPNTRRVKAVFFDLNGGTNDKSD